MAEENKNQSSASKANLTGGPQGVDKAPGEEVPTSTDNTIRDAQKGRNKNDGDPTEESDQPVENN